MAISDLPLIPKHRVLNKFIEKDPEFVELHGKDKILEYTGYPVIGKILNINDLDTIIETNVPLELEGLYFE